MHMVILCNPVGVLVYLDGPRADFSAVVTTVILHPNETMGTVPVPIMQDSRYEGAETFYARITLNGSYPGVQIAIHDSETEVFIIDDDGMFYQNAKFLVNYLLSDDLQQLKLHDFTKK